MLAMNDMFRQQLQLTRQFVALQSRLHHDLVTSLHSAAESYRYTTLDDTQEVKQHCVFIALVVTHTHANSVNQLETSHVEGKIY